MWVTARLQAVCKSKVVCLETANQLDGPLFWNLGRPRLASRRIDMEAAWNDGRSLFEWMKRLDLSLGGL